MSDIKPGDKVRMTEAFKAQLRGTCKHTSHAEEEMCLKCSSGHADEFGDSIGVVEGLADYNNAGEPYDPNKIGPEFRVRWPHNLRYSYGAEDLEIVT